MARRAGKLDWAWFITRECPLEQTVPGHGTRWNMFRNRWTYSICSRTFEYVPFVPGTVPWITKLFNFLKQSVPKGSPWL